MRRALLLVVIVAQAACLRSWSLGGPYACDAEGRCADGLTCDDGVCCQPGGAPACPTLAVAGVCASGRPPSRFFRDNDGDGFGAGEGRLFCARPVREAWAPERPEGVDCDDSDGGLPFNPRAPERCNGLDDNCNGQLDEGLSQRTPWYRDVDQDGFGDDDGGQLGGNVVVACAAPAGFVARAGDCNPLAADVFPGAVERCNNRDDNCNGQPDDAPFVDAESPGVTGSPTVDCQLVAGVCSAGGLECRRDAITQRSVLTCISRERRSTDVCDGVDNDCNTVVDDAPGCGGPPASQRLLERVDGDTLERDAGFLNTPRVRFGATRAPIPSTTQPSRLPRQCLAGGAGSLQPIDSQSWFNPAWVGSLGATDAGVPLRHTWYAEAEPERFWDLSRRTSLALGLRDATELGNTLFTTAHFPGPVVTLCGATDTDYLRFSPTPSNLLAQGGRVRQAIPLVGPSPGWVREASAGFDLRHVRRVEVTVSPFPVPNGGLFEIKTFTIVIDQGTGFLP